MVHMKDILPYVRKLFYLRLGVRTASRTVKPILWHAKKSSRQKKEYSIKIPATDNAAYFKKAGLQKENSLYLRKKDQYKQSLSPKYLLSFYFQGNTRPASTVFSY